VSAPLEGKSEPAALKAEPTPLSPAAAPAALKTRCADGCSGRGTCNEGLGECRYSRVFLTVALISQMPAPQVSALHDGSRLLHAGNSCLCGQPCADEGTRHTLHATC
jgi:hypothetical protein